MSRPLQVVVAVDLDDTGAVVMQRAAGLALRGGVSLHVCHATPLGGNAAADEQRIADAKRRLHAWLSPFVIDTPLTSLVQAYPGLGDPADVIVQLAVDVEADVIIVGSHRRRGIERWMDGSVSEEVLRRAPCSVFVALPSDFTGLDKSPSVEAASAEPQEERSRVRHPHTYHYRHTFNFNVSGGSVGPTAGPFPS